MANVFDTVNTPATPATTSTTPPARKNVFDTIAAPQQPNQDVAARRARALAAKSGPGAPARPSLLRLGVNALDFPLAAAESAVSDIPWDIQHITDPGYMATHEGPQMTQFRKDFDTGGINSVAENDVMFRKGALQRILADPTASSLNKKIAQHFMDHPWQAGAMDFIQEFVNPTNLGVGKAVQGAGKLYHAAQTALPALHIGSEMGGALGHAVSRMVGEPLADAAGAMGRGAMRAASSIPGTAGAVIKHFVNRYAGLAARGGTAYAHAAMAADAAPEHAAAEGDAFFDKQSEGLTPQQRWEVQRLSYVDQHGVPYATRNPNVPEPKGVEHPEQAPFVPPGPKQGVVPPGVIIPITNPKYQNIPSSHIVQYKKFASREDIQSVYDALAKRLDIPAPTLRFSEHTPGMAGYTERDGRITLVHRNQKADWNKALHEFAHWFAYNNNKGDPARLEQLLNDEHGTIWKATFGWVADEAHKMQQEAEAAARKAYDTESAQRAASGVGGGKVPTLEERAMAVRRYMMGRDSVQNLLGIRTKTQEIAPTGKQLAANPNAVPKTKAGDLYDSGTFFPMSMFDGNPVYRSQERVPEGELELGDQLEYGESAAEHRYRTRNKFSSAVSSVGHKEQGPLLTPQDWADIHPEYDPFYQLKHQYREVNKGIANETQKRALEHLPSINPETGNVRSIDVPGEGEQTATARMPLFYGLMHRDEPMIFGTGEEGARKMQRFIERTARGQAKGAARTDPAVVAAAQKAGIPLGLLGTPSVRRMDLQPIMQRIAEGKVSAKRAGQFTRALEGRVQRLASQESELERRAEAAGLTTPAKISKRPPMDEDAEAAARAFNRQRDADLNPVPLAAKEAATDEAATTARMSQVRMAQATANRVRKLQQSFEDQAQRTGTAKLFHDAAQRFYESTYKTIQQQVEAEAKKSLVPPGYAQESELGLGSPSARDMALDDSFAKFFQGAPKMAFSDDVKAAKAWKMFQIMNRMARLSIVLIPTVHGINNLGMHYLAEGGTPEDMAMIVARKKQFPQQLKDRAFDSGAATNWSQRAFSLHEDRLAELSPRDQAAAVRARGGPLSGVAAAATRAGRAVQDVYTKSNQWLFRDVEQGYAFDLFDRFTKPVSEGGLGMSDGAAALKVRNTLGRYDNVSPRELALGMNRVFYFYPWMKTVIPFWTKKGIVDPKWWSAPVRGIQTLNEQQGYDDPSKPFTMTVKNLGNGEFLRATAPIPQRVLGVLAGLARIGPDMFSGIGPDQLVHEDVAPTGEYVLGHLNPLLSVGLQGVEAIQSGTGRVAPYNVFRSEPGQTKGQYAGSVAGRTAGSVFAPMERMDTFWADPVGTIAGFVAGSAMYVQKSQGRKYTESVIRHEIDGWSAKAMHAAKIKGDDATINRLTKLRESIVQRAFQQLDHPKSFPSAQANPASAAAIPPGATPPSKNVFDTVSP